MESKEKEVYFHKYCGGCKHYKNAEDEEPCHECLNSPSNYDSHKPVKWEEK